MLNPTKPTTKLTPHEELLFHLENIAALLGEEPSWADNFIQLIDTYAQAKEREARIASVQLYMDTCENNSVDPSWESIHEFQDGQMKALADLEADKENL